MSEESYGLAALQFFCFPGDAQVASWRKVVQKPQLPFFSGQSEVGRSCDYFFGVACVFITYASDAYDKCLSTDECKNLKEFHERLDAYMFQPAGAWSETAVLEDENSFLLQSWERLRKNARKALDELGEILPNEPPVFDIPALVSFDEFRTSDEAKRLLE